MPAGAKLFTTRSAPRLVRVNTSVRPVASSRSTSATGGTVNLVMSPASVTEVVTVTGETPLVDVSQTTTGVNITPGTDGDNGDNGIEIVAVNDVMDPATLAHQAAVAALEGAETAMATFGTDPSAANVAGAPKLAALIAWVNRLELDSFIVSFPIK